MCWGLWRMLTPGDRLELEWVNEEGQRERYQTVVASQYNRHLYVEIPLNVKTKKYGYFLLGTVFHATFYKKEKAYRFETELLGRVRENIPLLLLSYPGDDQLQVIQRRDYFRVEAALDVAVHPVNRSFKPFTTLTYDISGGGLSAYLPKEVSEKLQPDMEVVLWLVLPMSSGRLYYLKNKSRLIRVYSDKGRSLASFQFIHLKNSERMHVMRYCFERDLYLKKELESKGV